jgi:hypothetical protein
MDDFQKTKAEFFQFVNELDSAPPSAMGESTLAGDVAQTASRIEPEMMKRMMEPSGAGLVEKSDVESFMNQLPQELIDNENKLAIFIDCLENQEKIAELKISENYEPSDLIDFLIELPPDAYEDYDNDLTEFLKDLIYFMDKDINEAAHYGNRTPSMKKVALRAYYRRNRKRILARIKRNKKKLKNQAHQRKKERMKKIGKRADGTAQKKNWGTKGHIVEDEFAQFRLKEKWDRYNLKYEKGMNFAKFVEPVSIECSRKMKLVSKKMQKKLEKEYNV